MIVRALFFGITLLLLPAAMAQEGPRPDTTDWHSYYPLAIGNEWQYRGNEIVYPYSFPSKFSQSDEIIRDTLIDAQLHFLLRRCVRFDGGELVCNDALVRYDEAFRTVVMRVDQPDGSATYDAWAGCQLDAPFSDAYIDLECPGGYIDPMIVLGEPGSTYCLGSACVVGTKKSFDNSCCGRDYVSGLGWVRAYAKGPGPTDLVYARVSGMEYGTRVLTSADEPPVPSGGEGASMIYPNPLRGGARLRLVLRRTQALTLEVFDARGRRVRVVDLGTRSAGLQTLPLEAAQLPAGAYWVRIHGSEGLLGQQAFIRMR